MRSPAEIRFRLRQELGNLAMLARPPRAPARPPQPLLRPETPDAHEVLAIADSVLAHRFPLLGLIIETGPEIDWRRDYLHKISSGTDYFRRVPYLDFARVGDHKVIWELNRHQHLVVLSQAYTLTGRREYLEEVFRQLGGWMDANPFLRGINWASALEVAFRALSWAWIWALVGEGMPPRFSRRFQEGLYRHGSFLERNLSIYFSPNTHLLGEAVALYALGLMFDETRWRTAGARWTEDAMERQVREDGSHFEQSAYYHVYALDFFLLYRQMAKPGPGYDAKLARMAGYLDALLGPSGILPLIGDDDGGRLFHPYGDRTRFGQATLDECAKRFPVARSNESRLFADAGTAVMRYEQIHVVIKAGPFGEGSGGHSHSDVLSLVVRLGDREILIDPGTYTYIADPAARDLFRGSAAHNTVRIEGRDQAVPAGPFRWREKPEVKIDRWDSTAQRDLLEASCRYGGFVHRRRVLLFKAEAVLIVVDTVEGGSGEQFWHLGADDDAQRFSFAELPVVVRTWRSRALCSKEPATALKLPAGAALIDLSPNPKSGTLDLHGGQITWCGRTYDLQS